MKTGKRNIQPADELVKYYSTPEYSNITEIPSATVEQTCAKIIQLVDKWKSQTERITKVLQLSKANREKTAKTIWQYFYTYFQYAEDNGGIEQLRSPRRAFFDSTKRKDNPNPTGCDCDCFTISILTMLANAGITDAAAKVIKRNNDTEYSHIYVVMPKHNDTPVNWNDSNTYYAIDPVVHEFNRETNDINNYKIYPMKNTTLNGLGNIQVASLDGINGIPNLPYYYPQIAKVIVNKIELLNPASLDYAIELQYAILFEQKWKEQGLIPIDSNYFITLNKYTGLGSFRSWVKDTWDKAKDILFNNEYDAKTNAMHALNLATFLPAREGLKQVIKYNVFGLASLLHYTKLKDNNKFKEVLKTWFKFGGETGTLEAYIREGKDTSPRQVAPEVLNRIPQIKGLIEKANTVYYNKYSINGLNGEPASTGAAIVEALPIILEITLAIGGLVAAIKAKNNADTGNTDNNGNTGDNGGSNNGEGEKPKAVGIDDMLLIGAAALGTKLIFF